MPFFEPQKWLDIEGKFTGESLVYKGPALEI
jgi:hypothetical protein